ncbi:alpha-glucosidase C-terminal domain-containing protein [candidate division KSB1 bacterium]|nr:alpha-glucosidase C-terminal domain-containing protein [candidate division KSB1 bacterium]
MKTKILSLAFIMGMVFLSCSIHNKAKYLTQTPEWAKSAIWYQIFPERFRNGDPSNDPEFKDIIGAWPPDPDSTWSISPWTSDWYKLQPWEDDGQGFYHHVFRRRYGGDIQGVLDKLDYITDLGFNAIYFNPMFEAPSLHKYDAFCYHHIDDNFGPNPHYDRTVTVNEIPDDPTTWQWTSADTLFLKMIKECHKRGIHVIIDGVWNHVGLNFWAFQDVIKHQENSKYKDWFDVKTWDDPATPANEFDYACWWDNKELPEFKEDENGLVTPVRNYIFNAVKRWMDPNNDGDPSDGIDGWRLDVPEDVALPFWRDFRLHVRKLNHEAYLVGELWWIHNTDDIHEKAQLWLANGDVFDGSMNYRFAWRTQQFFIADKGRISATKFDTLLATIRNDYPMSTNYVLQNLLDSHDTDRLASMIVNPDSIYNYDNNSLRTNPNYNVRKPNQFEVQIQKLIATFQLTYVGAPMIFYGTEAGMWGAKDPDDRKPMLWVDMVYDDEVSHPFNFPRPCDKNAVNHDLLTHYKQLIHIRNSCPSLRLGDFSTLLADDDKDVFAFERHYKKERIAVALNNSVKSQTVELLLPDADSWTDLLSDQEFNVTDGSIKLSVPPKTGMILLGN